MNLDQINELINKGYIGFALVLLAFALLIYVSRKDIEKIRRKTK